MIFPSDTYFHSKDHSEFNSTDPLLSIREIFPIVSANVLLDWYH